MCLSAWEIIKAALWRNMPSFCFLRDPCWQPPAILGSKYIQPSRWQRDSWAEIAGNVEKKWVYFILSCCLERSSKCNSCSLRDKQNGWFTSARPMARMICCGKSPCRAWSEYVWRCSFVKMLMLGARAAWLLTERSASLPIVEWLLLLFRCPVNKHFCPFLHLFDLALVLASQQYKSNYCIGLSLPIQPHSQVFQFPDLASEEWLTSAGP